MIRLQMLKAEKTLDGFTRSFICCLTLWLSSQSGRVKATKHSRVLQDLKKKNVAQGLSLLAKSKGSQRRQNVGEDRKLGKIFKFFMASIISWNTLPIFYAVLKDTGDRAWEVLRW